jgi:hypothetical protein
MSLWLAGVIGVGVGIVASTIVLYIVVAVFMDRNGL